MTPMPRTEREAELIDLIERLAHRILLAHEVIGKFAERRPPVAITEHDTPRE